ncbi:MAG: F0F1 ATP synthase subunit epsilon [Alphaproteobacteria bacterium GM7ARS4]|nr:F0F1 ATP synthase subunit epsilon [Alphaproteobacteria bacterium GM7ARS4]
MTYHCSLSTPQRSFVYGDVDRVDIAGAQGDFVAMAGHGLLFTPLREGVIRVHRSGGGAVTTYHVTGEGYAHVAQHGCIIMAHGLTERAS